MNWDIIISYVSLGTVALIMFAIYKIGDMLFDKLEEFLTSLRRPEPNRKRRFKNVNEIFTLNEAASEFGFVLYDKDNPMKKEELKSSFRNKVKRSHPDCGGNVDEFIRIKKAYDSLIPHTN